MADASVEDFSTLCDVPRPFDAVNGHIHTGPAYGLVRHRRRVKPALVIGADGSNVNLYSVKSSKLLASHALRPQSQLTAPPSATILKGRKGRTNVYVAVRDGVNSKKHQLILFAQDLHSPGRPLSEGSFPERKTVEIGSREDPVLRVEPGVNIFSAKDNLLQSHTLVIQASGRVTCFTHDLQKRKWSIDLNLQDNFEHAESGRRTNKASFAVADIALTYGNTFLKRRPDIMSQIATTLANRYKALQQSILVGLVTKSPYEHEDEDEQQMDHSTESFCLFSIRMAESTPTGHPKASRLIHHALPEVDERPPQSSCEYRLDLRHGLCARTTPSGVRVYDLLANVPNILYRLNVPDASLTDTVLIDRTLCLIIAREWCSLTDIRFGSIQSHKKLGKHPDGTGSKKRKRNGDLSLPGPLSSICYYGKTGVIAGLAGSSLVSASITWRSAGSASKKRKQGRLADALGKAFDISEFGTPSIRDGELLKLADIFKYDDPEEEKHGDPHLGLKIQYTSHELFHDMASNGYVTPSRIQQALAISPGTRGSVSGISAEAVLDALEHYDRSLMLVSELVFSSPSLSLDMLTNSLRILLHSFEIRSTSKEVQQHLLKDVTDLANGDLDRELQVEEDNATKELQLASELLEGGLEVRSSALRACLEKLSTIFHPREVSKAFKDILSKREIVLLLDVLRHELNEGGWNSHTLDFYPDAYLADNQAHAITAICTLINCAVDALGTGMLLPNEALPGNDGISTFITSLRSETSAVLESVQESSFFDGFLKDFLRYEQVLDDEKASRYSQQRRKKPKFFDEYLSSLIAPAALPIGSKSVERVSSTRIGAGGEIQKRPAREMNYKTSQQRGTYSFETIRFQ